MTLIFDKANYHPSPTFKKFKASLSQLNMNTAMLWTMLLDGSLLIRGAPHTGFPAVNIYTACIKTRLENLRCQNKTAKSAI